MKIKRIFLARMVRGMKRILLVMLTLALLLVGGHAVLAGSGQEIRSSLSGEVTWTTAPGTPVAEGSELVRISTLTGEAVAARALSDGRVEAVLVHPGETVAVGQVVARIVK